MVPGVNARHVKDELRHYPYGQMQLPFFNNEVELEQAVH